RQTGSRWAGLVAFAWFVLAPYGLLVSRSFQAEPVLACAFAAAMWHLSRPGRGQTWSETLVCGCGGGLGAFATPGVLFAPLLAVFAALVLRSRSARGIDLMAHVAAFAMLMAAPSLAYVALVLNHRGGELMPQLLAERWFYEGLAKMVAAVVGYPALAVGLAGAGVAARSGHYLLAALLAGYPAYIGLFTYHCATHDYYHTPLMVPVALGLGWFSTRITFTRCSGWAVAILLGLLCVEPWRYPRVMRTAPESTARTATYRAAREVVGPGAKVVAVTEDYGLPLEHE